MKKLITTLSLLGFCLLLDATAYAGDLDDGGVCRDYTPNCPGDLSPVCVCIPTEYGGTQCHWTCQ